MKINKTKQNKTKLPGVMIQNTEEVDTHGHARGI